MADSRWRIADSGGGRTEGGTLRIGGGRPSAVGGREGSGGRGWAARWGPPIVWMAVIFILSSDLGSDTHTSRFIIPFLKFFFPHLAPDTYLLAHHWIRKSWHLIEYAMLSVLWARALAGPGAPWRARHIGLAMAIAIGWAMADEIHQAFVPSRGPSALDVGIDAIGATLGQLARWLRLAARKPARPSGAGCGLPNVE